MAEYTVKATSVKKQPSTDFSAILHPSDMKDLKLDDNNYIKLKNIVFNMTNFYF